MSAQTKAVRGTTGCTAGIISLVLVLCGIGGCFYVCFPEKRPARDLSRFSTLEISAFTYLTPKELEAVRNHSFTPTTLQSIRDRSLSSRFHENIRLYGIKTLSPATAVALHACFPNADLTLPGVTSLDDEVAAILAKHRGSLHLDGVMEISTPAARSLAGHPGKTLSLRGLKELPNEQRTILKQHVGLVLPMAEKQGQ